MRAGSVVVDVAIDQGGCIETAKPTSHSDPTYVVDGVIHYCVTNMPGAVPRTSTLALSNVTLPYALELADCGLAEAARRDTALANGINVLNGKVTYQAVAEAFGLDYTPWEQAM
jgi:alanine dehydrogenase